MRSHWEFREGTGLLWLGKLKPVVDGVMPLCEEKAVYGILERGEPFGEIVLTL